MGLNISAYILKDKIKNSFGCTRYITDDFKFDSDKYSGDDDFVCNKTIEFEYVYDDINIPEPCYQRPKDLAVAIDWVKNNIYEGNQERLINLLEAMKENKNLYIYCGW